MTSKVWAPGDFVLAADLNTNFAGKADATPAAIGALFAQWFATLPTTLPSTAGQCWNNGGSLAIS